MLAPRIIIAVVILNLLFLVSGLAFNVIAAF